MSQNKTGRFLVVAPSARAIVSSISRAGHSCHAIDQFADRDTRQLCSVRRVRSMNRAAALASRADPGTSIVLGGGLENRIDHFQTLPSGVSICGCSVASIRDVRDPFLVRDALRGSGLPHLNLSARRPLTGQWIAKPKNSAGGLGVFGMEDLPATLHGGYWFQAFVPGPVYGGVFMSWRNRCELVGVTRQIVEPHGPHRFCYHGSVGPVELPHATIRQLANMAEVIAGAFKLAGWFGIDFALADDVPMLLEINPRYTASMELLERLAGRSLFGLHLDAVANRISSETVNFSEDVRGKSGKRYVFNRAEAPLPIRSEHLELIDDIARRNNRMVADIPCPGTTIDRHDPICTVFSSGIDAGLIVGQLKELDREITEALSS